MIDWQISVLTRERRAGSSNLTWFFPPRVSPINDISSQKMWPWRNSIGENKRLYPILSRFVFAMISNPSFLYPCHFNGADKNEQWSFECHLEGLIWRTICWCFHLHDFLLKSVSFVFDWGTAKESQILRSQKNDPIKLLYPT